MEKSQNPVISEFLNIYPPISTITTSNDTKKFLVYFNRLSLKRKTARKSTQKKNTLSKNKTNENNNPNQKVEIIIL